MDIEIKKDNWKKFFKVFGEKNHLRPVRLEVFDDSGIHTEVNTLPFNGIDLELKGKDSPIVNLCFGDEREAGKHLTHNINKVSQISLKVDDYCNEEVLELETDEKAKTLLIFEQLTEIGTD
ncbi:MAG: DUF5335 family protein [Thermodesulfobacteriota bacterium]